uniref:phage tail spike protein n=1 Tax=Aerococcus urinaeequi TaxID=51665 RepID=UPI00352A6B7A
LHDVDDNGVFWRYKIDTKNKRDGKFTLDGTYELFDDLKGKKIITDLRPYNYTAVRALTALLEDTGWQVGNVSTSKVGSSNWYYINTLSAFWGFLENWGVEFKPRMVFSQGKVVGRYIDIADRISDDYGKWYEYGSDLLTVEAETDLTNIATAYYGRGKGEEVSSAEDNASGQAGYGRKINFADIVWSKSSGDPVDKSFGQQFVELPELTELYGYEDGTPRYDIVEFDDIEDKAELLQATYNYAIENARPKVQFKSTVSEDGIAELGEVVTIIRDDLNIRYKTRIFKIKRSFFNNKIKNFEFGDELIVSQAKSTRQAQKAMQKQVDEVTKNWFVAMREAITDSFWNEDGYNYDLRLDYEYFLPCCYYSFDRPIDQDPTKVIYMGAGKLLIANSKDPNGEWIWQTAIDGNGINASLINTGVLNAELVQIGLNNIYSWLKLTEQGLEMEGSGGWRRSIYKSHSVEYRGGYSGYDEDAKAGAIGIFRTNYYENQLDSNWFEDQDSQRMNIAMAINYNYMLSLGYKDSEAGNQNRYKRFMTFDPQAINTPTNQWFTANEFYVNDNRVLKISDRLTVHTVLDMDGYEIANPSDVRLKTNIQDIDFDARQEMLKAGDLKQYKWNKDIKKNENKPNGEQIGLIAQENPFFANMESEDVHYLTISLNKQVNVMFQALKDEIEDHENTK